jgi:hypothetical protein
MPVVTGISFANCMGRDRFIDEAWFERGEGSGIMKGTSSLTFLVLFVLTSVQSAWAQSINTVTLTPSSPIQFTPWRLDITGIRGNTAIHPPAFPNLDFAYSRTGPDLMLDLLWLQEGAGVDIVEPYSKTYFMDPLPAGNYTLHLRSLVNGAPIATRNVPFTVVPEPAMLAMILPGSLLILRRRRVAAA